MGLIEPIDFDTSFIQNQASLDKKIIQTTFLLLFWTTKFKIPNDAPVNYQVSPVWN